MIAKILEKMTGKDDLERVAYKEDLAQLNAYLKKRHVFVPQRPKRFLDAATFTQEQLMEQIRKDSEQVRSGCRYFRVRIGCRRLLPRFHRT